METWRMFSINFIKYSWQRCFLVSIGRLFVSRACLRQGGHGNLVITRERWEQVKGEEEIEKLFWTGAKRRATKGFSEHGHESCQCHIYERIVRRQAWSLADSHDRLATRQPWKACKMRATKDGPWDWMKFGPTLFAATIVFPLWLCTHSKADALRHIVLFGPKAASLTWCCLHSCWPLSFHGTWDDRAPWLSFRSLCGCINASHTSLLCGAASTLACPSWWKDQLTQGSCLRKSKSAPPDWELPSGCAEEHLMPACLRPQPSGSPDRSPLEIGIPLSEVFAKLWTLPARQAAGQPRK